MDLRKQVVGERSICGEGVPEGALERIEERMPWVRIPRTENPRFPEEGSSALGKSGPKARPRGVVDGQQVEIPVLTV